MQRPQFIVGSILTAILATCSCSYQAAAEEKSPLDDAVAMWHMTDSERPVVEGPRLIVKGNVKLGVKLKGPLRAASIARGGDGLVAALDGGYLIAAGSAGKTVQLTGKEMTLALRLLDRREGWDAPLLGKNDKSDPFGLILYGKSGRLEHLWRTTPVEDRVTPEWFRAANKGGRLPADFVNGILRVGVPVKMIGPAGWHDVVVRFRGTVLEMFVDGVLVDEEWPHGALHQFCGPFLIGAGYEKGKLQSGFNGLIDHVALWDRALSDEEITAVSGGREHVARRDVEILGPKQASLQYWRPRGYNTYAGDCMCLFHDGTFHLFWLYDRRHHGSKWIMGAHQYAHCSTKDLIHWKHHPLAIPLDWQWESAMGTGDFIVHKGKYYGYYTDCGSRCQFPEKPHPGSGIFVTTSTDGIHFKKKPLPVVPGWDCTIFRDDRTGLFHLLTPGRADDGRNGLIDFVSKDMDKWTKQKAPLLEAVGCCPHYFRWNDWYYLTVGNGFWKSRGPTGPWIALKPHKLTFLWFPKTAAFTGNRRLASGWIGDEGWGGDIVFIELVQHKDGSLGTKFVPEMIPAAGDPIRLPLRKIAGDVSADGQAVKVKPGDGFAAGALAGVPQDARITLRVTPSREASRFGLCLRGSGKYERGIELQFDPAAKRAQFGSPHEGGMGRKPQQAIDHVTRLDRPFRLDIVAKGSIIHVCIDNRRTMITRRKDAKGDRLFFFAAGGEVTFDDIHVRPLRDN